MKSRTINLVLAAGLFILALWLVFKPRPEPVSPPASIPQGGEPVVVIPAPSPTASPLARTLPQSSPGSSAAPISPAPVAVVIPQPSTAAPSASLNADVTTAATGDNTARDARVDESKVRLMLRDYHTLTGGNPVGTNAEIMRAIMGGNPKQATLGPPEGMSLNGDGELVDQWGSPYFFHQISGEVTEIRSAGPDKHLYTADDVVTR